MYSSLISYAVFCLKKKSLRAILAAIHHGGRDRPLRGRGDVRVVEDDEGRLAAELEVQLLDVRLGRVHDLLARRGVAGEGDHVDLVTRREFVPDHDPGPGDE